MNTQADSALPGPLPPWRLGITSVAQHYRLRYPLAAEIVIEATQQALLRRWQPWLVALVVAVAWLTAWQVGLSSTARLGLLAGGIAIWQATGRWLAAGLVHRAALAKAARLATPDTSGWPQR
jgi:hypothetical protein